MGAIREGFSTVMLGKETIEMIKKKPPQTKRFGKPLIES